MKPKVDLSAKYAPSEDVVARDVQGEFIVIPITSGIGDVEDEIYTLNKTGRAVWEKLDGKRDLRAVAGALAAEFEGRTEKIEKDVLGIAEELLKRKMLVEK